MTIAHTTAGTAVTEADAGKATSFADAALGVAGHQVTDPILRELMHRSARGEITIEEAIARGREHIVGH